jgi:uncharacterized protein YodC (DUF2158 family)
MELNIGDVVLLKSGSIPMTVIAKNGETVMTQWYSEEDGSFPTMNFVAAALEVLDEDDMFDDMFDDDDDDETDDEFEDIENEGE